MFRELHDITITAGRESITYPGDTPFRRELVSTLADGAPFELSRLEMSAHLGTHLDAPAHFIAGGRRIEDYPVAELIFPAHVVEVAGDGPIPTTAVTGLDARPGDAVLFKTANSESGRCRSGDFDPSWVYLSADAAALCASRRFGLVGIDYLSIDGDDDDRYPAHHALLGAGVLVLESIDLAMVPAGAYTLICLPLKLARVEAAPVRAVLVR